MEINDSKLFEKCNRYSTLNISNGCTISDDILNKINIESISQSELNEQYVDYVFARRFVPMGSRLYENNGIVKSTSTVEASDVVRDIKHKYNLQYWQIFVDNRKYNVKFIIVIPDTSINVTLVKHDMELLGYYVGGTKTIYDQNDREWVVLQFEPYYQPSETRRVKGCVRLFHISPIENKDDIKKNGIIAKEKTIDNKNRFYYPKRCFFVNGHANHEDLEEVIESKISKIEPVNKVGIVSQAAQQEFAQKNQQEQNQNLAKENGESSLSDFMRTITNEKLKNRVME